MRELLANPFTLSLAADLVPGVEIADRDAFLMTWYAKLPAPRVDLCATRDPMVPLLVASITERTGTPQRREAVC